MYLQGINKGQNTHIGAIPLNLTECDNLMQHLSDTTDAIVNLREQLYSVSNVDYEIEIGSGDRKDCPIGFRIKGYEKTLKEFAKAKAAMKFVEIMIEDIDCLREELEMSANQRLKELLGKTFTPEDTNGLISNSGDKKCCTK